MEAANGQRFAAFQLVAMTLRFFREHALRELSSQCGTSIDNDDVRWTVTVPAIWNEQAKKFMRLAAYEVRRNGLIAVCVYTVEDRLISDGNRTKEKVSRRKQIARCARPDRVEICLTSSLVTLQNLFVISHTVCVQVPKIWGTLVPCPLGMWAWLTQLTEGR